MIARVSVSNLKLHQNVQKIPITIPDNILINHAHVLEPSRRHTFSIMSTCFLIETHHFAEEKRPSGALEKVVCANTVMLICP